MPMWINASIKKPRLGAEVFALLDDGSYAVLRYRRLSKTQKSFVFETETKTLCSWHVCENVTYWMYPPEVTG